MTAVQQPLTPHQVAEQRAAAYQARNDTIRALTDLSAELQVVTALLDTRQRTHKGMPGAEAKAAMHDALVAEIEVRHDKWTRWKDADRLGLLELPERHGATAAPLDINVASLDDEIRRSMRRHRGQLRKLFAPVWCALVPDNPPTRDLLAQVANMVTLLGPSTTSIDLAREIQTSAASHLDDCTRLVDGPEKAWAGTEVRCYYCERPTLHVLRQPETSEWVITCLKAPNADHYAPCVCNDPLCECKTRGTAHRHTWRNRGGYRSDSWETLRDRLGIRRAAHAVEPSEETDHG